MALFCPCRAPRLHHFCVPRRRYDRRRATGDGHRRGDRGGRRWTASGAAGALATRRADQTLIARLGRQLPGLFSTSANRCARWCAVCHPITLPRVARRCVASCADCLGLLERRSRPRRRRTLAAACVGPCCARRRPLLDLHARCTPDAAAHWTSTRRVGSPRGQCDYLGFPSLDRPERADALPPSDPLPVTGRQHVSTASTG